ncbi:MAG: zinc ribbon domain-containing protein [Desulfobulbaceae bacterium]|nr:zinc ribbon domain-containing protein [Desulfobulbaceae bacterium]
MPIYEYQCQECGKVAEVWQSISDDPMNSCPDCSGSMKKLISASSFQLKGGGWYADGYSGGSASTPSCGSADSGTAKPSCAAGGCGGCG